ncbi:MlaD family protein [Desulfogranum japonicum]|uniref:MlaD family protein n=1 Tax=Desulfogranum japonicum TaxID=231447 RepID=UPI0004174C5B|nr:MlaD family protein [Desulfogranum japonicum]
MEQPIQKPRYFFSPVWILPLLALCIGGWLLYTSIRDAGIDITVHFQDAKGITPGKTEVIFKGIPIGRVKDITIDKEMSGVDILIEMQKNTHPFLVEDTAFWLVKPEVSAGRISGLDTLFGGSYIGAQKGKSKTPSKRFEGLQERPPLDPAIPGLRFSLIADNLYSLQRGSNIYSKNLQIGHIEDYALRDDGKIVFNAYVRPRFSHLIKNETRFWNSSGLSLSGNLQQGLSVNIESLASLVYGGITCATDPNMEKTTEATSGAVFTLFKDFEDAEYGIHMRLQLSSGEGIMAGKTKVMYRGLKVGVVKEVVLNNDDMHTVTAHILLDPRGEKILRQNTKFWVIKPEIGLTGINNIETLLGGMYITFALGDGEYRDSFIAESGPMPQPTNREGKRFQLLTRDSGSLTIGAPVLYKRLQVGEITNITLNPNGTNVSIKILIYNEYAHLVRDNSVFWNVSGINVGGSISNIKINLASLQAMLAGGVSFLNPGQNLTSHDQAAEQTIFKLHADLGEALTSNEVLRSQGLLIKVTSESMPSLAIGSPLIYNNVTIGKVVSFKLDKNNTRVAIEILVNSPYTDLISTSSRVYNVSGITVEGGLRGIKVQLASFDTIVSGGLSLLNPEKGKPVKHGHTFELFTNRAAALHAGDIRVTLHFPHGKGIQKGTKLLYKGVSIGEVDTINLNENNTDIVATAYVLPERSDLLRSQSRLWLVKPQLSLTGAMHLDTLLTGPYIDVIQGKGTLCTEYTVQEKTALALVGQNGLTLILETPYLGSIAVGNPIYYRQIQIGQVTGYTLSPTNQQVWVSIRIDSEYSHLVYSGSKFWNSSGLRVKGGVFTGLSVSTESMEALLKGGISLATPEYEKMGMPAKNGDHFTLADKAEEQWLAWQPILPPPAEESTQKKTLGHEDTINE